MLRLKNRHGRIWLNVASSYLVMNEFVNLDNSPFLTLVPYYSILKYLLNADHLETLRAYRDAKSRAMLRKQNCRRRLPVAKESVDHILCSHFLEHVYPDQAAAIIRDFHRA